MDAALRLRSIPDCGGNSGHTGSGAAKSNRTSRIFENEEETCKRHCEACPYIPGNNGTGTHTLRIQQGNRRRIYDHTCRRPLSGTTRIW